MQSLQKINPWGLAKKSGINALEEAINQLDKEGEGEKSFVIAQALKKLGERLEAQYKEKAINYWLDNKELPAGFTMKESNKTTYNFKEDSKWNTLKSEITAREEILKKAAHTKDIVFDNLGELVPKVTIKTQAIFSTYAPK